MTINYNKSAIMMFNFKKATKKDQLEISKSKFPNVDQYKYLGQVLRKDLRLQDQLTALIKRINWITFKLTGLRRRNNLKLNLNLWTVFCMPSIRLSLLNMTLTNYGDRKKFNHCIKMMFKRFTTIPKNCPNRIVLQIMPNLELKSSLLRMEMEANEQRKKGFKVPTWVESANCWR